MERADGRTAGRRQHNAAAATSPAAAQTEHAGTRKWELTRGEVQHDLAIWRQSVLVMRMRIFDITEGTFTLQGDIRLFAMAVRQVIRCAELARSVLPPPRRTLVDQALAEFEQASPDAKQLRDVLDHFDAYLRGRGQMFPAGHPADYDNDYLQVCRPVTMWTTSRRCIPLPKAGPPTVGARCRPRGQCSVRAGRCCPPCAFDTCPADRRLHPVRPWRRRAVGDHPLGDLAAHTGGAGRRCLPAPPGVQLKHPMIRALTD